MNDSSVRTKRSAQPKPTEQVAKQRVSPVQLHGNYSIDPEEAPELEYRGRESLAKVHKLIAGANFPLDKPLVEYGLKRHFVEKGYDLDDSKDNKSILGVPDLYESLKRYGVSRSLHPDYHVLERAFNLTMAAFGCKDPDDRLQAYSLSEMDAGLLQIRLDKSSGYPNMTKKAEALELDIELAKEIVSGNKSYPPCVAYHRIQHGDGCPKTRLVWGYPLSMTLLEALFARPLYDKLLRFHDSPSAFGYWKSEVANAMIPIDNMSVRYALDYSKFDATIPARLIDSAFRILKTHFIMDESDDLIWNKLVFYFIHTEIVMPNGKRYRKHRGVPSGSYFTQIVDSIVNYMCIQYVMISLTGQPVDQDKTLVLGDDSYFGFPKVVSLEAIADRASELGITINVQKSDVYTSLSEKPTFLGSTWAWGLPHRELGDLVKRIVYPERFRQLPDQRDRQKIIMYAYLSTCPEAWSLLVDWHRVKSGNVASIYYDELRIPVDTLNPALRESVTWLNTKHSVPFNLCWIGPML